MASSRAIMRYSSIQNYSALPELRKLCAEGTTELEITELPLLDTVKFYELYDEADRLSAAQKTLSKRDIQSLDSTLPSSLTTFVAAVHALAVQVFKNLSHVLELPWERYLEEMHELNAPSGDTLRLLHSSSLSEPLEQLWSTLTLVFSPKTPGACLVKFGTALEVFAQGSIKATTSGISYPEDRKGGSYVGFRNGEVPKVARDMLLVYDLRPSTGVIYGPVAGAKMKPLSCDEMARRIRVRESSPYVD